MRDRFLDQDSVGRATRHHTVTTFCDAGSVVMLLAPDVRCGDIGDAGETGGACAFRQGFGALCLNFGEASGLTAGPDVKPPRPRST